MRRFGDLYYPDDDIITLELKDRLERESVYRGDRLQEALKFVPGHMRTIAMDVGAHVGAWSRELARHFGRVVAIEANPANAECLRANTAGMKVEVHQLALGAERAEVGIEKRKGGISSRVAGAGAVSMMRLDDLGPGRCAWPPSFVKVHVNGYELHVLRGAVEVLTVYKPVVTVVIKAASERYGVTPAAIPLFMERIGYRAVSRFKPYWTFVHA